MDKYKGNGDVEQRLDRIERWIVAHEESCAGAARAAELAGLRNVVDFKEIKDDLKALHKAAARINYYIGGAIVVATAVGQVLSQILSNTLK